MRSPRSRPIMAEGVYSNGYFLHAAASHLGDIVKVQTKGGVIVEGIFKTFSPSFQVSPSSIDSNQFYFIFLLRDLEKNFLLFIPLIHVIF